MSYIAADGDYADRGLVDEATHKSLLLCQLALRSPATPAGVRVSCLARISMLLDGLPLAQAKTGDCISGGAWRLGRDRCRAFSELAHAYRETGDAQSAAANYRRAAVLAEAHAACPAPDAVAGPSVEELHAQICAAWADVEESLGRTTEARRVRARTLRARNPVVP
ncbi:hypothetical protein H4R19_001573 [Coemansia spiralis]|nr:hypothetical protein H4R19_001573 [Coemansia spiralis]